jgi:hypothetical protein
MSLVLRTIIAIISILFILWWADRVVLFGAALVLILLLCIVCTWAIVTLLRDSRYGRERSV